jgi:hypothetical protein
MDFLNKKFIAAIDQLQEEITFLRQSINASREQQQRQFEQEHAEGALPSPPIRVEAETHERPDAERRAERNSSLRAQWITAVATIAAFIAAAVYAGIAASQLGRMKEAVHEATRAAKAAEDANVDSANHFLKDERPYVWGRVAPFVIAPNQKIMVNVYFTNFGKSPAIDDRGSGKIFWGKNAWEEAENWFKLPGKVPPPILGGSGEIIPPGVSSDPKKTFGGFTTYTSDKILSVQDVKWVLTHDLAVVVVFREMYTDTVGTLYWTDECGSRFTSGAVPACPTHNEIH